MRKTRVPKGEKYWYFAGNLKVKSTTEQDTIYDKSEWQNHNYFHTEEEANHMLKKLRAVLKGADVIEWHKVSEELPKETCECLICWETIKHKRKWTRKIMFRRDASNPEIWYFDDNEDGVVTPDYWMPIPELPKED